jgi:hypothetical protein
MDYSHSVMLGQIANLVSDFCCDEECTTLDAVRLLIADYQMYRGIAERSLIEQKYHVWSTHPN